MTLPADLTDDEVNMAVLRRFIHTGNSFFANAFYALVTLWDKCVNVAGKYADT